MSKRVFGEVLLTLALSAGVMFLLLAFLAPAQGAQERSIVVTHAVPHVLTVEEQILARLEVIETRLHETGPTGIFRKPSNPPSPGEATPQPPSSPPQFEFPDSPETDADPKSIKDWTPEQWKGFFDTVMYIITAILGLFGGGVSGGALSKKTVS